MESRCLTFCWKLLQVGAYFLKPAQVAAIREMVFSRGKLNPAALITSLVFKPIIKLSREYSMCYKDDLKGLSKILLQFHLNIRVESRVHRN